MGEETQADRAAKLNQAIDREYKGMDEPLKTVANATQFAVKEVASLGPKIELMPDAIDTRFRKALDEHKGTAPLNVIEIPVPWSKEKLVLRGKIAAQVARVLVVLGFLAFIYWRTAGEDPATSQTAMDEPQTIVAELASE